jgi:uncharacterized cupin superfamily protein
MYLKASAKAHITEEDYAIILSGESIFYLSEVTTDDQEEILSDGILAVVEEGTESSTDTTEFLANSIGATIRRIDTV